MTGLFISFEGIDGVGKTTQVNRLSYFLKSRGLRVLLTREPGGTSLGNRLRRILLQNNGNDPISPRTEALLFAADRAQHVDQIIRPALESGTVVISDRYIDSSLAYQVGGRKLTLDAVRKLNLWATDNLLPARTYLLDTEPALSRRRLSGLEDRMESAGDGFQARTRQAFLGLAAEDPDRVRLIDASQTVGKVWQSIQGDVVTLLDGDL